MTLVGERSPKGGIKTEKVKVGVQLPLPLRLLCPRPVHAWRPKLSLPWGWPVRP